MVRVLNLCIVGFGRDSIVVVVPVGAWTWTDLGRLGLGGCKVVGE